MQSHQKRVLVEIGMLVVTMQTTERLIASALTYAIPETRIRSIEDLSSAEERYSKQTLGKLVRQLKMRVEIDDDFTDVLHAFLQDRNSLIHDITRIPGFDLKTKAGLKSAEQFLDNLHANMVTVTKVFMSLLLEWSNQVGIRNEHEGRIRRFLGDLDGVAGDVFYKSRLTD